MTRAWNALAGTLFVVFVGATPPAAAQPMPTEGPAINPSIYKVPAGAKTVTVDCDDAKQTLAAALADKTAVDLNIVFSGTCKEYLTIERDRVAIRGKDATATLVGGIEITSARRVLLEGFLCRDNTQTDYCFGILENSSVTLHNIKVLNAGIRGVLFYNSVGLIDGLSIDKTGSTSMLIRGSDVRMEGELSFSNSLEGCLVIDTGTGVFSKIGRFTARDCAIGILVQQNASLNAPFANFNVHHNTFAGLVIATQSNMAYGGAIVAKNNAKSGIWVDDGSSISPLSNIVSGSSVVLENNGDAGISVTQGSLAELANVTTNTGSKYGLLIDDARLRIGNSKFSGNQKADVRLQFGGKATFLNNVDIAVVSCDATALIRGSKATCTRDEPTPSKTTAERATGDRK